MQYTFKVLFIFMHTLHNVSYKYVIIDVPLYCKYLCEVYLTRRTQKEKNASFKLSWNYPFPFSIVFDCNRKEACPRRLELFVIWIILVNKLGPYVHNTLVLYYSMCIVYNVIISDTSVPCKWCRTAIY